MRYRGEFWITATGETIWATGAGGHTFSANFCIPLESKDERLSAMRDHGWKRVEGLNVETWQLKGSDSAAIIDGLRNAYGDDIYYQHINLYVYSTDKYYVDTPIAGLKPSHALREYEQVR